MIGIQLQLVGGGLALLGILHAAFPRLFRWKEELAALSLINRQLMAVHTLFIGIMLGFFGAMDFVAGRTWPDPSPLLEVFLGGQALFWLVRLVVQLFVFDARLWRGHGTRTAIHVGLSVLWAYLAMLSAVAFWRVP